MPNFASYDWPVALSGLWFKLRHAVHALSFKETTGDNGCCLIVRQNILKWVMRFGYYSQSTVHVEETRLLTGKIQYHISLGPCVHNTYSHAATIHVHVYELTLPGNGGICM